MVWIVPTLVTLLAEVYMQRTFEVMKVFVVPNNERPRDGVRLETVR